MNHDNSGTARRVYMKINGDDRTKTRLDHKEYDTFQPSHCDQFVIESLYHLDDINYIQLWTESKNWYNIIKDSWELYTVRISGNGSYIQLDCNCWIGRSMKVANITVFQRSPYDMYLDSTPKKYPQFLYHSCFSSNPDVGRRANQRWISFLG